MIGNIFDRASSLVGPYTWWFLLPLTGLPLAWYYFLPRLEPGIPYDARSAKRPWGDLPKMTKAAKEGNDVLAVFSDSCFDLNSPLIQFLAGPLAKAPLLILTDFREIEDILTRRTKEFDRLDQTKDRINPLLRESTVNMQSNDRFKAQRKLWTGVMTPEFVNKIASLHVHTSCMNLIELWHRKADLAKGQPFDAVTDLRYEGFDAIWGFTFGTELGSTKAQLRHQLEVNPESISLSGNDEEPAVLPQGEPPEFYELIMKLITRFETIDASLLPELKIWLIVKSPSFRRAIRERNAKITELVASSRAKFTDKDYADEELATSAMDQVLRRLHNSKIESLTSDAKDPDQHLKDELFLFIIAGYDTTATAMSWMVKFFAANQARQTRLREELQAALPGTKAPSAQAILKADLPYLDAFVAEVLRCSMMIGAIGRVAKCNTSILGKSVRKESFILMCTNAQSFLGKERLTVTEEERSESSKTYGGARGQRYEWPLEGRQEFRPERWLRTEEITTPQGGTAEQTIYDEHAGPNMPFGLGPRGCFGKRLALTKLRINVTLLVLNFEFLEVRGKCRTEKGKEVDMAGTEGQEGLARRPKRAYVRLRSLK